MAYLQKFISNNWGENEILRLADRYGIGEFVKFSLVENGLPTPQIKQYGRYTVSYPDIENIVGNRICLLVEVKTRSDFHKANGFLAIKRKAYNSYDIVRKNENVPVRVVYLIGDEKSYNLYWFDVSEFEKIEKSLYMFQDYGDDKEYPYYFFHSSELQTDEVSLFDWIE